MIHIKTEIESTHEVAPGILGVLIQPTSIDLSIGEPFEKDGEVVRPVRTILIERLGEDDYRLSSRMHYYTLDKFEDAFEVHPVTLKPVLKQASLEQLIQPFGVVLKD